MKVTHCTLTGVDINTNLTMLAELSRRYPIAEWGFLYSPKRQGWPGRYPSISFLQRTLMSLPPDISVALHVCGAGVHDLLQRESVVTGLVNVINGRKGRVQLNFNQNKDPVDIEALAALMNDYPNITFITQYNSANRHLVVDFSTQANHAVLFDASGGEGIHPGAWQPPFNGVRCGYAGGLNSQSLPSDLTAIEKAAGNASVWVDMESSLRKKDESDVDWFDLAECETCLSAVTTWAEVLQGSEDRSTGQNNITHGLALKSDALPVD